jgi:hypothetical protein
MVTGSHHGLVMHGVARHPRLGHPIYSWRDTSLPHLFRTNNVFHLSTSSDLSTRVGPVGLERAAPVAGLFGSLSTLSWRRTAASVGRGVPSPLGDQRLFSDLPRPQNRHVDRLRSQHGEDGGSQLGLSVVPR